MLLANLTVDDAACEELLQLNSGGMEGLHMALLLRLFVTSAVTLDAPVALPPPTAQQQQQQQAEQQQQQGQQQPQGQGQQQQQAGQQKQQQQPDAGGAEPAEGDPCEHLGAVITNVTRLKEGRAMLLEPGRGLLQALASQLLVVPGGGGAGAGRRRGCAGALRNIFLSAEADGSLDAVLADDAVLERVLAPLSGAPNTDPDDNVREALAEAVAALACEPSGRGKAALLKLDADTKLSKGYEYEEHPGVCAAMEMAARSWILGSGDGEGEAAEGAEAPATVITEEN